MAGVKGRSGRRPLPDEIKKMRGTYREPTVPQPPVHFPVTPPEDVVPPQWIADNPHALAEWERVVPLLNEVKVLTDPDLFALASYCSSCAVAVDAQEALNRDGLMLVDDVGAAYPHPMIKVAREARQQALRYAVEFGLTPAARSRIVGQQPKEQKRDEAEEFLFHPPRLVVGDGA